jgi:hypothetical protein
MYTSTEQILLAYKQGDIAIDEAEKKILEVQKKGTASSRKKTIIRNYVKEKASSFLEVLKMLEITVSRFKVLKQSDRQYELLENCTPEEAIAALGALKIYLPSAVNFHNQHEKLLSEVTYNAPSSRTSKDVESDDLFDDEEFDLEYSRSNGAKMLV